MRNIVGIPFGLVLLALAALAFDFLRHGGQFVDLPPQSTNDCRTVELAGSAEDIQIDHARGIAYLSSLDRRAQIAGENVSGTVLRLDLGQELLQARAALSFDPAGFRPHGMSLYLPTDADARLFVISHPAQANHHVELFEQTINGDFAPIATIEDPLFVRPNAIAAIGPRQFYVANDSGARNWFERVQEVLFRRGLSSIVYYTGDSARVVDDRLRSVAGIALSADLMRLYASETNGKALRVYKRDLATGAIELLESVALNGSPDNLSVAADGSVWLAVHPRSLALVRHFFNASTPAPTMVLRYDPSASDGARLTAIYVNHGTEISAGSVAAPYDNKFVIGSITAPKLLICKRS